MLVVYVFVLLFVVFVSYFVCCLVRRNSARFGLVDLPGERKIHAESVPTGGGIGIFAGVVVFFALCQLIVFVHAQTNVLNGIIPEMILVRFDGVMQRCVQLWFLLGLGAVMMVLGVLDDRFNLHWLLRLFVQTAVASAAVYNGVRLTVFIDVPVLTAVLSVIWIVGLTNSFNMLDNMNGLSGGVAAICGLFLALIMFISPNYETLEPQYFIAGFLVVIVSSLIGFLLHNNPFYAKLFMGNGGSYFIGFLLSVVTLLATFSSNYTMPQTVFVPLLILAVPLYDMISVITIRIKNGKSPFEGDKNHFSHRLVELGFSQTQAVLIIYLLTTICCVGAVLLYQIEFHGAVLIFLQILMILLLVAILEQSKQR
jgi:UDP-GlcNAc:undecaprenyl-phosphate GlcNAc-1-phosphate transferase